MRDSTTETSVDTGHGTERARSDTTTPKPMEPLEFRRWLEANRERIATRWLSEVTNRLERRSKPVLGLLERFYVLFIRILGEGFGPYREQVDPVWRHSAKLYGEFGAKRALAAGEIIEEFQILREALIRLLFTDPSVSLDSALSLRQALRLNRVVDRGVTHASVGYTDALFFALLEGPGVSESITPELLDEVGDQLDQLTAEFEDLMRSLPS